jgi:HSP20 family protein
MSTRIIRRTVAPVSSDVLSLRDMMNQLMENAFISPEQWFGDWSPARGVGAPAIDVTENNDAYVIKAALPGWKPENVDITFEAGTVTLKGEVNEDNAGGQDQNNGNTQWHRREIRRTSFARSVTLPSDVEVEKANAEFENGILTLTLPKSEVMKPKQIKITAK